MALNESAEMYLETIYKLSLTIIHVRSVDVAEALSYSRPSVSRAVGLLKNDGYLTMDTDGFLALTKKGTEAAEKIYERHDVLTQYLISLGVPEAIAEEDACKVEHVISEESFDALKSEWTKKKACK